MDKILPTISSIYDAAIDPDGWNKALAEVSQLTNSVGYNVFLLDHDTGFVPFHTSIGIPDELLAEYNSYYVTKDPGIEFFTKNPDKEFYFNYRHTDEKEIGRHEYYDWLEKSGGARYYLANTFKFDQRYSMIATSQRDKKSGHAQKKDFEMMGQITPHLDRAVRINQLFKDIDLRMKAAHDALEQLPYGVFLLSASSSVVYMNDMGRDIIARADGIELKNGGIHAVDNLCDRKVQNLIKSNLGMKSGSYLVGYIQIPRSGDAMAYAFQVMPLRTSHRLFSKEQPEAIVIMGDPSKKLRLQTDSLSILYGLTEAEAKLALLLATGMRPQEICIAMSISENTLKTHRKHIYIKVGVETQSQLSHVLNSL